MAKKFEINDETWICMIKNFQSLVVCATGEECRSYIDKVLQLCLRVGCAKSLKLFVTTFEKCIEKSIFLLWDGRKQWLEVKECVWEAIGCLVTRGREGGERIRLGLLSPFVFCFWHVMPRWLVTLSYNWVSRLASCAKKCILFTCLIVMRRMNYLKDGWVVRFECPTTFELSETLCNSRANKRPRAALNLVVAT